MKTTRILTLIMLLLAPVGFQPVYASPLMMAAQGAALKIKSPQQAVNLAKGKYGGKVLKVESARVKGNPGYRVKLVTSKGKVINVLIDATNGRIQGG